MPQTEAQKEALKRYRSTEAYRLKRREYENNRYATDEAFRLKVLNRAKANAKNKNVDLIQDNTETVETN